MESYTAFVVSDGTGRTAERALDAALTQFGDVRIDVVRVQNVRTRDDVVRVVREAAAARAFIIHTLVTDELRGDILRIGRQYNVETIDLMGTLLGRLSELFSVSPALFAENQGQWAEESVRFVHDGAGANIAMTDTGPVLQLTHHRQRY